MDDAPAPRIAARIKRSPLRVASFIALAAAIGLGIYGYIPAAVILVVVSVAMDRPRHVCGDCGARVESRASLCPVCRAHLTDPKSAKKAQERQSAYVAARARAGLRRTGG